MSAFGVGQDIASAIQEEHPDRGCPSHDDLRRSFDAEVVVLSTASRKELLERGEELHRGLVDQSGKALVDIAYTLNSSGSATPTNRLAIVATSIADLQRKLASALGRLVDPSCSRIEERDGVYYTDTPLSASGALAFLFPGQGAQYANMLDDLCLHFPDVRAWFGLMDRAFAQHERTVLPSQVVFPRPSELPSTHPEALWAMDYGFAAVFAANQALYSLLSRLDIRPDAVVGHSTGQFSALWAAGVVRVDETELVRQALGLNKVYEQMCHEGRIPAGALLAVGTAERSRVLALVQGSNGALTVAMDNSPHQIVLGGSVEAVAAAAGELAGAVCTTLPFEHPYHTPHFAEFSVRLDKHYRQLEFSPPRIPVYSCVTAARCPDKPEVMRRLVTEFGSAVRFRETIETMYRDGVRIFVEVGPRGNLTAFVDDILGDRPHLAVPANVAERSGVAQLAHLVGLLAAHHVPMNLEALYAQRSPHRLQTEDLRRPARARTAPCPTPAVGSSTPAQSTEMRERVMAAYLDTMDRFLDVQRGITSLLLDPSRATVPRPTTGVPEHP